MIFVGTRSKSNWQGSQNHLPVDGVAVVVEWEDEEVEIVTVEVVEVVVVVMVEVVIDMEVEEEVGEGIDTVPIRYY